MVAKIKSPAAQKEWSVRTMKTGRREGTCSAAENAPMIVFPSRPISARLTLIVSSPWKSSCLQNVKTTRKPTLVPAQAMNGTYGVKTCGICHRPVSGDVQARRSRSGQGKASSGVMCE